MIAIHYPTAYKALDTYVDDFNSRTSQSSQKLKTATVAAAKEIIRIYGASLIKKPANEIQDQLPPLRTNNKQLATLIKCSSRSVQRYILKLRQASVVTGKKLHGSNANYELWINPQILLANGDLSVNSQQALLKLPGLTKSFTQVKPSFFEPQRTDRLPSYSGNFINNILKEDDNVDFLENDLSGNTSGNTRKIAEEESTSGNKSSAAGGSAPLPVEINEQTQANEQDLNRNVELFWFTAKNLLYKYTSITERQEQTAKRLIKELYLQKSNRDSDAVHQMYIRRIQLAAAYVQKDPIKRFIPLPYIYFDPGNSKGFMGTEEWYWESRKYKADVDRELLLERLIRRYVNNDHQLMSKKQPPLKLYKACEKRLSAYNDVSLMSRFYTAVLNHHNIQP